MGVRVLIGWRMGSCGGGLQRVGLWVLCDEIVLLFCCFGTGTQRIHGTVESRVFDMEEGQRDALPTNLEGNESVRPAGRLFRTCRKAWICWAGGCSS